MSPFYSIFGPLFAKRGSFVSLLLKSLIAILWREMRVVLEIFIFSWCRFGKIVVFLVLKKLCTLIRFSPPLKVGHIRYFRWSTTFPKSKQKELSRQLAQFESWTISDISKWMWTAWCIIRILKLRVYSNTIMKEYIRYIYQIVKRTIVTFI